MRSAEYFNLLRRTEPYPFESVDRGLTSIGLRRTNRFDRRPECALVTWTPWRGSLADKIGTSHVKNGGSWIVMENGYLPHAEGKRFFAIGANGFNGRGNHYASNRGRLKALGHKVLPWRNNGEHVLVVGQMGHRDTSVSMPIRWLESVVKELRSYTDREIVCHPKSGTKDPFIIGGDVRIDRSNVDALFDRCWCLVTWSSKAAVLALARGIPIIVVGPYSIAKDMSKHSISDVENLYYPDDRENFLEKIADSQWSVEEIENGSAFRRFIP